MLDRRRFLVSSGIGAGLLLQSCKTTAGLGSDLDGDDAAPVVMRRRWTPGAQDDFKKKYQDAVSWLKANDKQSFPAEDPRSYLSWDKIVGIHRASCQHGNHLLLPWHRLYLQYFEQACRFALQDASFALPYWDWTLDRAVPDEFWQGDLYQFRQLKKYNPNAVAPTEAQLEEFKQRKIFLESADKTECELKDATVGREKIDAILENDSWGAFHGSWPNPRIRRRGGWGGSLENGPHNFVHREVGGEMSDQFNSPVDPLFWLHHCNIDRLWAMWQSRFPNNVIPPKSDGLPILFGDGTPWDEKELTLDRDNANRERNRIAELPASDWNRKVEPALRVQAIVSTRSLGFSYDTIPEPLPIRLVKKLVVKRRFLDSYEVTGPQSRRATVLVGSFSFADANASALLRRLKSERSMYLTAVLADIDLPPDEIKRAAELRVFVSAEKDFAPRPGFFEATLSDKANYVGSAYFFGHSHDRNDHKVDFAFDLSAIVRDLAAKGDISELRVLVVAANNENASRPFSLFPETASAALSLSFDGTK